MPKEAEYTLAWSSNLQGYEVIHGPSSFSVDDTTSLQFWLDRADTFHFSSEVGVHLHSEKRSETAWKWLLVCIQAGQWEGQEKVSRGYTQGDTCHPRGCCTVLCETAPTT